MASRFTHVCAWVTLAALVAGCDKAPEQDEARQAAVDEAVSEVARVAGEDADESGDCGKLGYLLETLPGGETVDGLSRSYRGCESPMTANLQYEDEQRGIYYTISILDAEMADLPGQADAWQGLLDLNRQAIEGLINTQLDLIQVASQPMAPGAPHPLSDIERARLPREVKLPNGAQGVIYNEGEDWTLVSLIRDRYALRIDLLNAATQLADTTAAETALMARVADINFAGLQ